MNKNNPLKHMLLVALLLFMCLSKTTATDTIWTNYTGLAPDTIAISYESLCIEDIESMLLAWQRNFDVYPIEYDTLGNLPDSVSFIIPDFNSSHVYELKYTINDTNEIPYGNFEVPINTIAFEEISNYTHFDASDLPLAMSVVKDPSLFNTSARAMDDHTLADGNGQMLVANPIYYNGITPYFYQTKITVEKGQEYLIESYLANTSKNNGGNIKIQRDIIDYVPDGNDASILEITPSGTWNRWMAFTKAVEDGEIIIEYRSSGTSGGNGIAMDDNKACKVGNRSFVIMPNNIPHIEAHDDSIQITEQLFATYNPKEIVDTTLANCPIDSITTNIDTFYCQDIGTSHKVILTAWSSIFSYSDSCFITVLDDNHNADYTPYTLDTTFHMYEIDTLIGHLNIDSARGITTNRLESITQQGDNNNNNITWLPNGDFTYISNATNVSSYENFIYKVNAINDSSSVGVLSIEVKPTPEVYCTEISLSEEEMEFCTYDQGHILSVGFEKNTPLRYTIIYSKEAIDQGFKDIALTSIEENTNNIEIELNFPSYVSPGTYSSELIFYDIKCDPQIFTLTHTFKYPNDSLLVQKWDDIIAVRESYDEKIFIAYEWKKDGEILPNETKSYIYINNGINNGSNYSVVLTADDSTKIETCPFIPNSSNKSITISKSICTPSETIEVLGDCDIQYIDIYNSQGNIIGSRLKDNNNNTFTAPSLHGIYIIRLQSKLGNTSTYRLLVK